MEKLEIKGKITHVLAVQSGTSKAGKDYIKQDFVIQTEGEYPKDVCFTLFGAKVDQFKPVIGEIVTVSFDVQSREFDGRWFSNINAWKLERETKAPQKHGETVPESKDDMPF